MVVQIYVLWLSPELETLAVLGCFFFFLSPGLGSLSFAEFSILKRQQYHVSLIPFKGFSGHGIIYSDTG